MHDLILDEIFVDHSKIIGSANGLRVLPFQPNSVSCDCKHFIETKIFI